MEFHRASLSYFSIAALCLLKPLFVLGESELQSFPSPNRLQSLGQLCLTLRRERQPGVVPSLAVFLNIQARDSHSGQAQRDPCPRGHRLGEGSVGSNAVLCSPREGGAGIFCAEPWCPSQNTSKVVYFPGTEGTGAVCCVQPRLCNPQRLPRK